MTKKNQHYIPQGYLRKFAIEEKKSLIWEYDKIKGTVSRSPVSTRKICSRNYYYSQKGENGKDDNMSMENAFEKIECLAAPIIAKIQPEKPLQNIKLEGKDRGHLAFFIALLLTRGPSFRDGVHDMHEQIVDKTLRILYKNGKLPEPPKALKELIDKRSVNAVIRTDILPQVSLKPMIEIAEIIGNALLNKIWNYHTPANDMTFVTADNPVHFCLPEKYAEKYPRMPIGPAHPLSEITIPLRKDLALICLPLGGLSNKKFSQLDGLVVKPSKDDTLKINERTCSSARQYIYSSLKSDDLLKMIKGLKGTGQFIEVGKNTRGSSIGSRISWLIT